MKTLELDADGKIAIPPELQDALGITAGDKLCYIVDDGILFLSIADVPLEDIIAEAEEDYRAGRTISIEEFAKERGFELDESA